MNYPKVEILVNKGEKIIVKFAKGVHTTKLTMLDMSHEKKEEKNHIYDQSSQLCQLSLFIW